MIDPLDAAHDELQDVLDAFPPESWSLDETLAIVAFIRRLPAKRPARSCSGRVSFRAPRPA